MRTVSVPKLYLLSVWKTERDLLIESASSQRLQPYFITAHHLCST